LWCTYAPTVDRQRLHKAVPIAADDVPDSEILDACYPHDQLELPVLPDDELDALAKVEKAKGDKNDRKRKRKAQGDATPKVMPKAKPKMKPTDDAKPKIKPNLDAKPKKTAKPKVKRPMTMRDDEFWRYSGDRSPKRKAQPTTKPKMTLEPASPEQKDRKGDEAPSASTAPISAADGMTTAVQPVLHDEGSPMADSTSSDSDGSSSSSSSSSSSD
jgi:hypothetical protein